MYCLQLAFIKQEALEKAREIKVKADEEFAIEKVRPSTPRTRSSTGRNSHRMLRAAYVSPCAGEAG